MERDLQERGTARAVLHSPQRNRAKPLFESYYASLQNPMIIWSKQFVLPATSGRKYVDFPYETFPNGYTYRI